MPDCRRQLRLGLRSVRASLRAPLLPTVLAEDRPPQSRERHTRSHVTVRITSRPGRGDGPAGVLRPQVARVPGVGAAIASYIYGVVVMANELVRIVPRFERDALTAVPCLGAECRVLGELRGAVVGLQVELESVVPQVLAGVVGGLEGDAGAVGQARVDDPGGVGLGGRGTAGRDRGDDHLGVAVVVLDVVAGAAGGGRLEGDARAGGRADGGRGGVSGRGDVGLHRVLGGVGGVDACHDAFVEGAGRALAVVAADAQDDRAFLVHRVVARGPRAAVERRQASGLGVAAADGPEVRAALDDRGGEAVVDRRVVAVVARVHPAEQAVLQVGHDPRTVAGAVAPGRLVAEVDGLHVTVAGVGVAGLRVAVVEAAAGVVVGAVEDRVLALGVVTGGDAAGGVVAVAGAGRDEHAVDLVAAQKRRRRGGVREVVRPAGRAARRGLSQVVAASRLVVNDRDVAVRAGAERVLRGGVGHAARGE